MPDGSATARPAGPPDSGPTKRLIYEARGETVNIAATVEWIIDLLAEHFARTAHNTAGRQWEDLKSALRQRELNDSVQTELAAVAAYFKVRTAAAHAPLIVLGVGGDAQIFRMRRGLSGGTLISLEDLRQEAATARAGYEALQAIAVALDESDPAVLADLSIHARAMLGVA